MYAINKNATMTELTFRQLKMPAKLGRLPNLIGEPAGGSLTADQWLTFATVVAPLAVNSFCSLGNMAPNDQSRYPKFGRIMPEVTLM